MHGVTADPPRPSAPAVVAIDGPSGSGKSTVARRVAQRLGFRYLDTGAMYRALTWQALDRRVDLADGAALGELAARVAHRAGDQPRRPTVVIDGVDVSVPIRSREVTNASPPSPPYRPSGPRSSAGSARSRGRIVVEGRDIGTTVVPDATLKVFLTASSDARAARRHRQLAAVGDASVVADTQAEIERRDRRDSTRTASPLAQAADAVVVDSTTRTVDEVVGEVLAAAARRGLVGRRKPERPGAGRQPGTSERDSRRPGQPAAADAGRGTPAPFLPLPEMVRAARSG